MSEIINMVLATQNILTIHQFKQAVTYNSVTKIVSHSSVFSMKE